MKAVKIRLSDKLYWEVTDLVALEGTSFRSLLEEVLEKEIAERRKNDRLRTALDSMKQYRQANGREK